MLIDTNQRRTAQLDQLQMSFLRETKLLDKEIKGGVTMKNLDTDKIIGVGLIVALILRTGVHKG